jgi:hypothetical protein
MAAGTYVTMFEAADREVAERLDLAIEAAKEAADAGSLRADSDA